MGSGIAFATVNISHKVLPPTPHANSNLSEYCDSARAAARSHDSVSTSGITEVDCRPEFVQTANSTIRYDKRLEDVYVRISARRGLQKARMAVVHG